MGDEMKKWVIIYTRVLDDVLVRKIGNLNPGTVITVDEERGAYCHAVGIGWVANKDVEPYVENYPTNCVDIAEIQTANPNDPQQYVNWKGITQYNMCGELCVSYIMGISLAELLKTWEVKMPSSWKRVFGQGKARGTGNGELIEMFNSLGETARIYNERTFTPHAAGLLSGLAIASVKIDGVTGILRGQGILHWVVITNVMEERCGNGLVEVYNPFQNRLEVYSWREFVASAQSPYGAVLIKKE
jgi:hypothetical protein